MVCALKVTAAEKGRAVRREGILQGRAVELSAAGPEGPRGDGSSRPVVPPLCRSECEEGVGEKSPGWEHHCCKGTAPPPHCLPGCGGVWTHACVWTHVCRCVCVCGPTCVGVCVCVDPWVYVFVNPCMCVCEPTGVCVRGPTCVGVGVCVDPCVSVWVGV